MFMYLPLEAQLQWMIKPGHRSLKNEKFCLQMPRESKVIRHIISKQIERADTEFVHWLLALSLIHFISWILFVPWISILQKEGTLGSTANFYPMILIVSEILVQRWKRASKLLLQRNSCIIYGWNRWNV